MSDLPEIKKEPEEAPEEDERQTTPQFAPDAGDGAGANATASNNASEDGTATTTATASSSGGGSDAKDGDAASNSNTTSSSEGTAAVKEEETASSTTASSSSATSASVTVKKERSEDYDKLIACGLDPKVASRLDEIYQTGTDQTAINSFAARCKPRRSILCPGKLTHSDLDERALDALKEFPTEGALAVLAQFLESNLEHVSNKSAYLCGVMKTYRQKTRASGSASALLNGGAGSVTGSANGGGGAGTGAGNAGGGGAGSINGSRGPDERKIKEILDRTGYTLDVTTGQRKYGGPPPGWEGDPPGNGCEVRLGGYIPDHSSPICDSSLLFREGILR